MDEDNMDSLQEKIKELTVSFQELLECPVCFGTMDSTLKLCINGHGVCNLCAGKIEKCPTCKQELAPVLRQNTLLEQVLERLPKLCPYSDKGCNTVLFDQEHKTYCEYRPTECLKTDCVWKGCVKDLLAHIKRCQTYRRVELCELSLDFEQPRNYIGILNQSQTYFTPIICQNQVFWKYCHRDGTTKCIYHELYTVPTSKPSCDYYLKIRFRKEELEVKQFCKGKPYKSHPNEDKMKSGLIIPDSEMKNFLEPGSENKFEYTIKLVKKDVELPIKKCEKQLGTDRVEA